MASALDPGDAGAVVREFRHDEARGNGGRRPIDEPGPVIAGGTVFVNSGYWTFVHMPLALGTGGPDASGADRLERPVRTGQRGRARSRLQNLATAATTVPPKAGGTEGPVAAGLPRVSRPNRASGTSPTRTSPAGGRWRAPAGVR